MRAGSLNWGRRRGQLRLLLRRCLHSLRDLTCVSDIISGFVCNTVLFVALKTSPSCLEGQDGDGGGPLGKILEKLTAASRRVERVADRKRVCMWCGSVEQKNRDPVVEMLKGMVRAERSCASLGRHRGVNVFLKARLLREGHAQVEAKSGTAVLAYARLWMARFLG